MKSKSLFLAFAAALAVFVPNFVRAADEAPPPPPPGEGRPPRGGGGGGGRMGPNLEQLTTALSLTDEQQAKIKPILEDSRKQMQAIRDDSSLSDDDKRSKGMAARKATHDQIRAVLTPEQQQKFDDMGPGPGGPGGPKKKKSE